MLQIDGKTLVFTDLHLGLKNGAKNRLAICVNVVKKIINYAKSNSVKNILFLGDWHHSRIFLESNVLNVSYKLMQALAKNFKVYLVVGNHDIYMKNSVDINSLIMFRSISNVHVVDKAIEFSLNGNKSLLAPWLADLSSLAKNSYDMMFGHFDASHQYLVKSYIEDHSNKTKVASAVEGKIASALGVQTPQSAGDFIGDYVELAKECGTIFSGHIHGHRVFTAKQRKFIFVGDPYQQNLGEKDSICGFYVIDEDNEYRFEELEGLPKHFEFNISDVMKAGIDKFDFSRAKDNIVHKIYDMQISNEDDAKILQKINDLHPYEELIPDYNIAMAYDSSTSEQIQTIDLMKKSKLEYISNYIGNIDKKVLEEQNIDPERLYKVMEKYYQKAEAER